MAVGDRPRPPPGLGEWRGLATRPLTLPRSSGFVARQLQLLSPLAPPRLKAVAFSFPEQCPNGPAPSPGPAAASLPVEGGCASIHKSCLKRLVCKAGPTQRVTIKRHLQAPLPGSGRAAAQQRCFAAAPSAAGVRLGATPRHRASEKGPRRNCRGARFCTTKKSAAKG